MAYRPVDRSYTPEYLAKQHNAMRWLAEQGLTLEEIRSFSFGNIEEWNKQLKILRSVRRVRLDLKTGNITSNDVEVWIKIPIKNTPFYNFFIKDKFPCPFLFTREKPKSWRRELSRDSLYSSSEIHQICGKLLDRPINDPLTKVLEFGTIEVSKLNITNLKARGQVEMLKV